ncbi:MAG: hypothetical protein UY44_C0013G0003 [Candidatus Kaiserbacteria bacterium GW2011_GWA2_49_19]|uniref:Uncharacterized protein n=1 Tax=Candidatus Kaiserbacteria bacterium GW2011_GWA2_49_19 TaxID=1618669 RepID=A0A0G1VPN2_9BACT|nr:MAG: hypothetical protein UY44_C0013G0003 [Candidatus Kaiserbacteria bacterium GW2011_GWA2_49_19]
MGFFWFWAKIFDKNGKKVYNSMLFFYKLSDYYGGSGGEKRLKQAFFPLTSQTLPKGAAEKIHDDEVE